MAFFYRIRAIFTITFKRLWAQRSLTLVTIFGLMTAVALIMTVPLYADAVYFRILQERLSVGAENTRKPPFAYMYDYIGSWAGTVEWQDIQEVDAYLTNEGSRSLGLPQELMVRHLETDRYRLFPAGGANYADNSQALGIVFFATTTGIEEHITLLEGAFPAAAPAEAGSPIEVLVTGAMATELGLQVGDSFIAYDFGESQTNPRETPVRIAGIWEAADPDSDFWFFAPTVFDDLFIVPEETFTQRLSPLLSNEIARALWYLVLDGGGVNTTNADALAARSYQVARRTDTLLPNIRDAVSPAEELSQYQGLARQLTVLLAAFNVPIIGLILAFIGLIVGLSVNQRRNEIAVIRSRGGTPWQILGFAFLEGLVLGAIALALGTVAALGLTQLMGKSRSFLDFSAPADLRVALTADAWQAAVVAIVLAIVAQVLPTIAASQDTIITYKQEQARSVNRPWWQRAWLDILLLIPALYGYYQLQQQGSIVALAQAEPGSNPFANPLLFLIPVLAVLSLTLLFIRLLPWLMAVVSWLLAQTNSISLLMAARQLARTPRLYAMPLILLVLTTSLAIFTASLAQTMDFQLYDESLYNVGADVNLRGAGVDFTPVSLVPGQSDASDVEHAIFLPLAEYRDFPGVTAATRVGRYDAEAQIGSQSVHGTYLGIDRVDFSRVAYWRWDFASYRLGSLLNTLARSADAVLVSQDFAGARGLRPGDFIRLTVGVPDGEVELNAQIAATFSYFPTWYPGEDGPLFVGNRDALFAQIGGEMPYEVWLETEGQPDAEGLNQALRERGLFRWSWEEPYEQVFAEQLRPDRQGVFGLLSVGYIAAALLTVMGFFMYALFSLRQRLITMGILRAVGLSQRHMTLFVALELAFLILSGLGLGTGLGVLVSRQFIPHLQIGTNAADLIPPYLVEIAWPAVVQVYILFALLFVIALVMLALILGHMKIFQAIKLGETV